MLLENYIINLKEEKFNINKHRFHERYKEFKKISSPKTVIAVRVSSNDKLVLFTEKIEETFGNRQLEKNLTDKSLRLLRKLPICAAKKRFAGPGKKGEPDITGCLNGLRLELEVKIGDNKPTDKQWEQMEKWANAGAITGVYWTISGLKALIDLHLSQIQLSILDKSRIK